MNIDILIIWWWPSWCSAWILLKKYWYNVVIIDKLQFPKHTIWESLLPIVTSDYMKILWIENDIKKCWFPKKYGTTFIWWKTRKSWNVFFDKRLDVDKTRFTIEEKNKILSWNYIHSYQVNRYKFDQLFVNKAKKDGIIFHENIKINDIYIEDDFIKWVRLNNNEIMKPKFIIDASWQESVLWNKLNLRKFNKELWFTAIYWYFKNCNFIDNFLSKHTQYIISVDSWWVWFIHIWENIVSIGFVSAKKKLIKNDFFNIINNTPECKKLFNENTNQVDYLGKESDELYKVRNWSYFNNKIYWKNYLMIWDAAGFVDPVLSWWLSIALMSWILWSVYINKYLKTWKIDALRKYQEKVFYDINNYYELAKYWYWNNKSTDSWFWRAKNILWLNIDNKFNKRAFTFIASWNYYIKENLNNLNEIRIESFWYDHEDINEIRHLISEENIDYIKIKYALNKINNDLTDFEYKKNMLFIFKCIDNFINQINLIDKDIANLYKKIQEINKIEFIYFFFDDKNFLEILESISKNKITDKLFILLFSYIVFILKKYFIRNFQYNLFISVSINIENILLYNGVLINFNNILDKLYWDIIFNWEYIYINKLKVSINDINIKYNNYLS